MSALVLSRDRSVSALRAALVCLCLAWFVACLAYLAAVLSPIIVLSALGVALYYLPRALHYLALAFCLVLALSVRILAHVYTLLTAEPVRRPRRQPVRPLTAAEWDDSAHKAQVGLEPSILVLDAPPPAAPVATLYVLPDATPQVPLGWTLLETDSPDSPEPTPPAPAVPARNVYRLHTAETLAAAAVPSATAAALARVPAAALDAYPTPLLALLAYRTGYRGVSARAWYLRVLRPLCQPAKSKRAS